MRPGRRRLPLQGRTIATVFLLLALCLILYLPTLHYPFIHYDDPAYITENENVLNGLSLSGLYWALTTTWACNWHPLTWLSHMMDVQLFGTNAGAHHMVNVLFHSANSLMLFFLLRGLTGAFWRSAIVAALFAVHPQRVESVAWISERKDLLSAFFFLAAIHQYATYLRHQRTRNYLSLIAVYTLAIFSKPMAVTLPVVLLVLDYWPLGRWGREGEAASLNRAAGPARPRWDIIKEKLPLIFLAAACSLNTFVAQARGGCMASLEALSPADRLAAVMVNYGAYLYKAAAPVALASPYPHPGIALPWREVLTATALVLALTVLLIRMGGRLPFLSAGWAWFLTTLVPVIGFVQVGAQGIADRYTYLPHIGLYMIVVWGGGEVATRHRKARKLLIVMALLLLTAFALISRRQLVLWQDARALFVHATEAAEENYLAYHFLGMIENSQGQYARAIEDLEQALVHSPDNQESLYLIGVALFRMGRIEDAIWQLRRALSLRPEDARVSHHLAKAYCLAGNLAAAEAFYRLTIDMEPRFHEARIDFAEFLGALGRRQEAAACLVPVLRSEPSNERALSALSAFQMPRRDVKGPCE